MATFFGSNFLRIEISIDKVMMRRIKINNSKWGAKDGVGVESGINQKLTMYL